MKAAAELTEDDLPPLLARIDEIWGAKPGTPEGEELDRLATIVDEAERRLYPFGDEEESDCETIRETFMTFYDLRENDECRENPIAQTTEGY